MTIFRSIEVYRGHADHTWDVITIRRPIDISDEEATESAIEIVNAVANRRGLDLSFTGLYWLQPVEDAEALGWEDENETEV